MSIFSKTLSEQEQTHLWKQFKEGDRHALGQLAAYHYRSLFGYGEKFSKDPEFVRDCIQDLFLGLWERRSFISETLFVRSYLLKSLRNTIIDESIRLKRFRGAGDLSFDTDSTDAGIELLIIEKEHHDQQITYLENAIKQLTKRQQEIIYLRFYQGLSNQQTAEVMGLGYQSVANLLYRTLKEIKENWLLTGLYTLTIIYLL